MAHHCAACAAISRLHAEYLARRRLQAPTVVRGWCRKCGGAAIISFGTLTYSQALEGLRTLDRTPFEHEGYFHTELGGWGIRWRFDEMLRAAFPADYARDPGAPHWPRPDAYPVHEAAEQRPVTVVADVEREDDDHAAARRQLAAEINARARDRGELEAEHGPVWNTDELRAEFEVSAFRAPFAVVRRRMDGVLGSVLFQCEPRFYFAFRPDRTAL